MNPGLFIFRELVSAMRVKSGALFLSMIVLIFLFLGVFSCFFILGTPENTGSVHTASSEEITVYLSPQITTAAIQQLYQSLLERNDVASVIYAFAEELPTDHLGGAFLVRAADQNKLASLTAELKRTPGVTDVVAPARAASFSGIKLSSPERIGLLIGLLVSGLSSLFVARAAFMELLRGFSSEIKLLRLSGTPERAIQIPVAFLGLATGLLAGIILFIVIYVLHVSASSGALLTAAAGLLDRSRVLAAGLLSLFLGVLMGALSGVLGASLLSKFQD